MTGQNLELSLKFEALYKVRRKNVEIFVNCKKLTLTDIAIKVTLVHSRKVYKVQKDA